MPDAREQTRLFDDRRRAGPGVAVAMAQHFQRHFAIEPGVPGAIDVAMGAPAHSLEHAQRAPCRAIGSGFAIERQIGYRLEQRIRGQRN